jgi:putative transposase
MAQSFVCLNYHLIFSTKGREPILSDAIRPRLYEYVGGMLRAGHSKLIAAGGMPVSARHPQPPGAGPQH